MSYLSTSVPHELCYSMAVKHSGVYNLKTQQSNGGWWIPSIVPRMTDGEFNKMFASIKAEQDAKLLIRDMEQDDQVWADCKSWVDHEEDADMMRGYNAKIKSRKHA